MKVDLALELLAHTPLTEDDKLTALTLSPNPFSNTLHINAQGNVSVSLTDVTGRYIGNYYGTATEVNKHLDDQAVILNSGIYLLRATNARGISKMFKIAKQ